MSDPYARYLAYASRVKLMMARAAKVAAKTANANIRYLAYSSDVGESARPIVPGWAVNAAYVVAIGYVAADVGYHGYLDKQRGNDDMCVARNTLQHATFQIIASLAIPTIIIHTAVHQVSAFSTLPTSSLLYVTSLLLPPFHFLTPPDSTRLE